MMARKTQHTLSAGWHWQHVKSNPEGPVALCSDAGGDILMATGDECARAWIQVNEEHMALIAAAPDLLFLINRALADRIDDEWLKRARAVVAKAGGN